MQPARGETREAERLQQIARPATDVVGHELADTDHLVAVVRVRDHVRIVAKAVEYRKVVGGEATDAARRFLTVERQLAFDALLAEREVRTSNVREIVADDEIR